MTFLKGTETKYGVKTKRVLISKEQKNRYKREEDVETRRAFDRKLSFGSSIEHRRKFMEI